jgi:hypothetical protein
VVALDDGGDEECDGWDGWRRGGGVCRAGKNLFIVLT